MHEMAIAQGILDIALTANQQEGGGRITKIKLNIGEMTGVEPDALLFCFGALAAGTAASEADLDIEVIPLTGRCESCGISARPAADNYEMLHDPLLAEKLELSA